MTSIPLPPLEGEVVAPGELAKRAGISAGQAESAALDRSFARGIAWVGSVKWVVQLVTWGTTIVVARILSPSDYGLLAMGTVLLSFITLLSESGIGLTVITVRDITAEQTAQINGAALLMGVATFAVACLLAVPIGMFYRASALPLVIITMSFALIISSFRVVPGALLQRDLRFPRLAAIDAAQAIGQALVTVILAILGFRYWSLVCGALLGATIGTIATLLARPYAFKWPRWTTLKPVLPFTRNVVVGRLFWYAYQNADFIVAGKRLGVLALGAYSYAWTLASMPVDKISALVTSVTPSIFSAAQHDIPALRRYFLTVTEGLAVFAFPLTVGMALVASDFVPVVFGDRWLFMVGPLQILAAYTTIRAISPISSQVLFVTGDTRFLMYMSGLGAVVLPTGFYIGSRWGTIGIAIAWTIVHPLAVYLPLSARVFKRLELGIGAYLKALWPALSGCALMGAAVALARSAAPVTTPQALRLSLEVAAGAAAYSAGLMLFHRSRVTAFIALWRR
jgi:O-antigen/teichoic acid export membrane protein